MPIARVLPAPPTTDTQSRAWGGERERDEVGVTSVVQFVRARAPCGLIAGGWAICSEMFVYAGVCVRLADILDDRKIK